MSKLEACPQTHHAGYPLEHAPDLFSVFNIRSYMSSKFQVLYPMDSIVYLTLPLPAANVVLEAFSCSGLLVYVCCGSGGGIHLRKGKQNHICIYLMLGLFAVGGMPDMAVGNIHLETKTIFMSTKYAL